MPSLLLEIGCEELPAGACREAEAQLPELARAHIGTAPSQLFVGPRRLAFLIDDLPEQTADLWVKGPPENLRDRAAAGFAKKHGVAVDELELRDGFLGVTVPGRELREVLPEQIDRIVRGFSFTKSMRWDESGIRFARPVRWVLAKLDAETIVGETSYGHRFTHGIAEVVHLVEKPMVLEGHFDERFLQLPERVIVTTMQSHQRYFPIEGNRFALVANGGDPDVVGPGHTQVLEARLEDASFTFERDVAAGIDALAERLAAITFFAGAGSFAEKAERVAKLVERLGGGDASLEAARLAKADQASELVREFPELEGYIGAEYARLAGYPDAVTKAIEEQYLPDASGGLLPQTEPGKVLAAADKLDTLRVAFELGHKPSGSRDPYGLRRAAIGLVRLALEGGLTIDRELLPEELREFVEERLESLLDVPVEYVRAARASNVPDLGGVARRAEELYRERESPEFEGVYTAYDRAHRLAGKAQEEAGHQGSARVRRGVGAGNGTLLRRGARDGRGRGRQGEPASSPARRARHPRRARRLFADPALASGSMAKTPVELHVVSDSTGETATRLVHALEAQFPDQEFEEIRHPRVETVDHLRLAVERAKGRPAVVVYTLVEPELREQMRVLCRRARLHYCDLLGHPIDAVARVSGQAAQMTPGARPPLDSGYFKRMAAIEFAVKYDDGMGGGLHEADIVLVGVSRTSKTPLSMYLGYLGYKTANVPIVKGIEPPPALYEIDPLKIVGLTIEAGRLAEIRQQRVRRLGGNNRQYAKLVEIYDELEAAEAIHRRLGCPVIEISDLSIEETAARVIRLIEQRRAEAGATLTTA